jgi:hypothetical protein
VTDESVREYLSRLGRRGADATNNQLTPAQRKRKAQKAAKARWAKTKRLVAEIKEGSKELLDAELKKASAKSKKAKKAKA